MFFCYKIDQKKNCDLEQVPAADLLYEFVEEAAAENMGLGLGSIQKMMEQMAGDMFCVEDKGDPAKMSLNEEIYYELCLLFRVTDGRGREKRRKK